MDPYEQRLREEVIYLHSLWRQGPPRNPNPNPKPEHNSSRNLHPSKSTPFKKNNNTKNKKIRSERGNNNNNNNNKNPESDPPKISDVEWPCEKPVAKTPLSTSGWPALKPHSATARSASAEEEVKYIATQMQQKGLLACRGFFSQNGGSDCDDEEDEDNSVDMDGCDECEEYEFFFKVFMENSELRSYYEKNYEGGEFFCLVCGGLGKKLKKKFKSCVALVQHSTAISKTLKKRAHRAYGQVICKVLGWDINRLPTIVLSLGGPLNRSLAKGDPKESAEGDKDNLSVQNQEKDLPGKLMVGENASKEGNANINMEDFDKEILGLEANKEGSMNCSESLKADGVGSVGIEIKNIQEEIVVLDGPKEDGANQKKQSLSECQGNEALNGT